MHSLNAATRVSAVEMAASLFYSIFFCSTTDLKFGKKNIFSCVSSITLIKYEVLQDKAKIIQDITNIKR